MIWRVWVVALVGLFLLSVSGCGGSPPAGTDAGSDAASGPDTGPECTTAADCDDGLVCNGAEACTGARCVLGTPMRCNDMVACTLDTCSEELRRCVFRVPDEDGDGAGAASCVDGMGVALGTDCDDTDANRFPTNAEVCDAMGHDEDCQGTTHGGTDADGDGEESISCCNGTDCGTDCNDGRRDVHPGAVEVCNVVDDDCNGMIDEGVTITVYTDADHDGDGAITAMPTQACASTAGVSVYHTDCADDDRTRSGRLVEVCDTIDNDCDTTADDHTSDVTWYRDGDMDGFGSPASGTMVSCIPPTGFSLYGTDCDDTTNTRSPARAEICDGLDDDCNGAADFRIAAGDLEDDDGDGNADLMCGAPFGHDCDDHDPSSAPGTTETCDGRDNDCDTHVDEDATTVAFFRDVDGDGFGSTINGTIVACVPSAGYVRQGGDCDDDDVLRHPGGVEGCNATDDDCDGAVDEGGASAMCSGIAHTTRVCISGVCSAVACETGFGDCTFLTAGCETDLRTDPASCGACGRTCGVGGYCASGGCMTIPAGAVAHYDVRVTGSVVTDASGNVSRWNDLTSAHNDLVPYDGMAVLRPALIGGRSAIDFAGAALVSSFAYRVPPELTVFFVVQHRSPQMWGAYGHHGSRDVDWSMEQSGFDGSDVIHFQSGNDNMFDEVTLTTDGTYILVGRVSGTLLDVSAYPAGGGAPLTAFVVSSSITGMPGLLYVGGSDAHEHSNGYMGEILYYDRALTNLERDEVVVYLRTEWGI